MDFLGDPILFIAGLLRDLFTVWGWEEWVITFVLKFLGAFAVANFGMLFVIALIWLERKLAARMQDRIGPNRVGRYGLGQTIADILKLFTKEDTTPAGADKVVFNLAPILAVFAVIMIWAVIPLAEKWVGTELNVGILYIIAVGSIGIVSTLIAGWSSNNKFALLGAFRTVAQLVSYEVPMILSMMIPVLLAGSMGLNTIVGAQANWWSAFFWMAPIATIIFFISSIAEVGRTPFDLLEAESEIVAGFHIEYSGAKFAMIFAAEFLHAFTISVLTITLFFGGWRGVGAETYSTVGWIWFMLKSLTAYFVVAWIRTTLPRIRIDHMLNFNWKFLTPLILAVLVVTAILVKVMQESFLWEAGVNWEFSAVLFAANILIGWATLAIVRSQIAKRPERKKVAEPRPVARPPESEMPAAS